VVPAGGYLFLARTEDKRRALEQSVKLQRECGLSSRMLTPNEARAIVPELDIDGIVAATYNRTTASSSRGPSCGLRAGARKRGAEVATFTDVVGFETSGARIEASSCATSRPAPASRPTRFARTKS